MGKINGVVHQTAPFWRRKEPVWKQTIIMAAIILILGSGAFFFIFVIQNYYLVDKTLKQTKDYTRQVIASMANGLLSIDTEGKIASYNRPAIELLDLTESEARGNNLNSLIDFNVSGIRKTVTDCVFVLDQEILHKNKKGEVVPLALIGCQRIRRDLVMSSH